MEIGALATPIVPRDWENVVYVDFTDTPTLRARYADDPKVDADDIVDVDVVWGATSLAEAMGGRTVDVVVGSHVIEHVPDLITWLQEIAEVLSPTGQVRMAVPDRRFSFDLLRRETTLSDLVAPHALRARIPQPHQVADFAVNMAEVDPIDAWLNRVEREDLEHHFPFNDVFGLVRDVVDNGTYHDVHCWVFTPESFATLMMDVCLQGLSDLGCRELLETAEGEYEFIVAMARCEDPDAAAASWRRAWDSLGGDSVTEIGRLRQELDESKALVAMYAASPWWRVSAPLRATVTWLRQRRG